MATIQIARSIFFHHDGSLGAAQNERRIKTRIDLEHLRQRMLDFRGRARRKAGKRTTKRFELRGDDCIGCRWHVLERRCGQ